MIIHLFSLHLCIDTMNSERLAAKRLEALGAFGSIESYLEPLKPFGTTEAIGTIETIRNH